jgi:hypothetical protein
MNWAWAASLDQLWRSADFPIWLTLAAAGFFGIIVLITLLRAEKSVANGALTVITLLAVGIAVAATIRGFGPGGRTASTETQSPPPAMAALPALACIDDLAGEAVLTACEKALFGSPESAAAALSYAASQLARLTSFGDVAAANTNLTPELQTLRRAVERDRYGLMAYVLVARDHCTPLACSAFQALTDSHQIAANMEARVYDDLVAHYAPLWNAPPAPAPVATLAPTMPMGKPTNAEFPTAASIPPVSIMSPEPGAPTTPAPRAPASTPVATLAPTMPMGKPTNAEFPTAASIPPVSIMSPEPGAPTTPAPRAPASTPVANAPLPSPRPASAAPTLAAAKKQATAKSSSKPAPVQLAPAAPAPAAAND